MMEICGVIYEFTDDTPPVVMEYCGNKNLEEIYRYITENETEIIGMP